MRIDIADHVPSPGSKQMRGTHTRGATGGHLETGRDGGVSLEAMLIGLASGQRVNVRG
jgi:hypothetical protein